MKLPGTLRGASAARMRSADRVAKRAASAAARPRRRSVLVAAFALSLLAGGEAAADTISLGTVAPGPTYWPVYVSQDLGLFQKQGLTLTIYSSGGTTAQQLVVNAVNIACSGFPDFMRARNGGAHVKLFMNAISSPPYIVYAKPTIKSATDLKGKTISIGGVHDVTLLYVDKLLASAGLKSSDVDFVYAKAAGERFSALAGGAVDAAILNPPSTFRAATRGFSNVGDISKLMKDFPFTVWAVNTDWGAQHQHDVVGFAKAYREATTWLYDPKHKDQAISILKKHAKLSESDAADSYAYMVADLHAYSTSGTITEAAFGKMTDALIRLADIKAPAPPLSFFYDASYLSKAKAP